ncbi:MAG: hypothetical protein D9V47_14490 [Clostridia bacterium]|nr:MAG: hypothetical protein D9V47_14490 [Clostridia bacterium]
MARNLLRLRIDLDTVAEATGLTLEEIGIKEGTAIALVGSYQLGQMEDERHGLYPILGSPA